jgi:hypothetical protein
MTHVAVVRALAVLLAVVASTGLAAPPAAEAQVNVTGQWSTMSQLAPVQPIHVALMHTGKVLMIEGSSNDSTQTVYRYTVWNPATGAFSTGTTPWDLFCNSMTFFPDGRLLISGGNAGYNPYRGLKTTTIFDPTTEKFIQVEDTAKGRWYPTALLLQDGGVMSFSGLDENAVPNPDTEIYDLGTGWAGPYVAPFEPKYYPRLHLLGNGKVLMTGPDPATRTFDPATGTWTPTIISHPYGSSRMYGTSVMLPLKSSDGYAMRFFVTGGDTSQPTSGAHLLDTSLATWTWRALPSLDQPRVTHNAVILPNGKVLVVGGSAQFNVASTAAMNALLFDPATETWGPAGTIAFPRMYHSTAILLPDATVWLGGSNPTEGVWTPQMEIYKPPYLFTSTGAAAPRPSISSSPAVTGYGATFSVGTAQAQNISQVVLVRAGSVTHAFDMDQRLIQLSFTKGAGTLGVTSPPNAFVAPPGYYMLFVLDANGVPSVAKFIRLAQNPSNQPPVATITNPSSSTVSIQAGQSVTFAASASDPDGSVTTYHWLFPGGAPGKSTVASPGAVTFSTPGTYTASLTVLDNLGDNNVSPPTVTVVVGSGPSLGAAITSPANGATVSGTVTINMSASNVQGSPTTFVLKTGSTTISNQSVSGSTATASWNTTGLAPGSYPLNLTVTNAGRTATASITVTVGSGPPANGDTTPPSVTITAPTGNVWTGNSINIAASATDNVGLANIKLWGNGGVFATLPCSGATCSGDVWWITGSLPPAAYEVNAVATDTAGNQAVSAKVTIFKDATSPVVPSGASTGGTPPPPPPLGAAITSPANGATVSGTVTINMSASNVQGAPTTFVLQTGSTTISNQSVSGSTATASWNTSGLAAGNYPLNLTVTNAGRTATASITVTVSSSPPPSPPLGAAITSPASGATVSGTVTINMSASNVQGSPTTFVLQTGSTTISNQSVTGSTATASWNTTGLTPGSYPLNLTVTNAGRTATASITVTVSGSAPPPTGGDTAPPSVTITAPTGNVWTGNSINIAATATDNVGLANIKLWGNGAVFATLPCSGTSCSGNTWWITGSLPPAAYEVNAVATDTAGNQTVSAKVTIFKDATSPVVPSGASGGGTPPPAALGAAITSPANGATVSGSVTINMSASNVQGSPTTFVLQTGSTTISNQSVSGSTATATWNTSGLAAGSYPLNLTVTNAGRTATASITVTVSSGAPPPPPPGGDAPPTVTITSPPNGAWTGNSIDVHVSGTDAVGLVSLKVFGNGTQVGTVNCTGTSCSGVVWWLTGSLPSGQHTITATATDTAGNTTTSSPVVINK